MSVLGQVVQWTWGIGVVIQVIVLGLLLLRGHFRKLPMFTAYMAANLSQAALLYFAYSRFGFTSRPSQELAWLSEICTLTLKVLATMEVLRLVLRPYRGIWGLGWRLLGIAFSVVILYAGVSAGRNVLWAIILADRGFHLAFAIALVACLLLIRYYAIAVESPYKAILGGFCVYSCTVVLANTVLSQVHALRGVAGVEPMWQLTTIAAYAGVQGAWAAGLWKAAPAKQARPALLAGSLYRQLSPQINERLDLLNKQLGQIWQPKATRQ